MRRAKIDDSGIKGMLKDEYERCINLIEQIKHTLADFPKGRLVIKKVKSKDHIYEYYHLQWRQGDKVLSKHIPQREIPEVKKKIEQRDAYRSNYDLLEKRVSYLAPLIGEKKPVRKSFKNISREAH